MNLAFVIAFGGPVFVCFVGLAIVYYWDEKRRKDEAKGREKK